MKKYRLLYNYYHEHPQRLDCNWYEFEAKNNKTAIMVAKTFCKEHGFYVSKIITGDKQIF